MCTPHPFTQIHVIAQNRQTDRQTDTHTYTNTNTQTHTQPQSNMQEFHAQSTMNATET